MREHTYRRALCALVRNLFLAAFIYGVLFVGIHVYQTGTAPSPVRLFKGRPADVPSDRIDPPTTQIDIPPNTLKLENINPNANWFNRPITLAEIKYDYMGKRPDVDTVANLTRLVETCRGSEDKLEKMRYVQDCMRYLDKNETDYYYIPQERASKQSPKDSEYGNADGNHNTLDKYPKYKAHSKSNRGKCNGAIVDYHVYWTGPATWRVDFFIKSYFHTQNIPCSRLWIWLDSDKNPHAVDDMLSRDPVFAKYLPLVERGDITLHAWNFPSRIPLPKGDNTDGVGYWKSPGRPNAAGETEVADGLVRDQDGQEWLVLTPKQMTFLPVAVSDAVRFVVLHLYGGAYFDMDILLLRDMRPLLIGKDHSFAERWAAHSGSGDYNTAVMSLIANSTLSSYLVRGGVRMGLNFHPRIIGQMAVKDNRNGEFLMLETAAFDPIWTEFNWDRMGQCTVPCFRDYSIPFKGGRNTFPKDDEWEAFEGPQVPRISGLNVRQSKLDLRHIARGERHSTRVGSITKFDEEELAKTPYKFEEDNYPPTNRTMENFFRGAWSYHIHNQWRRQPQPSSWFAVVQHAHNVYFSGQEPNAYGEYWTGPAVADYSIGWEFT